MRCPHSCQLMKNRLCVHRNQLKQRPVIDNCHPTHASCHANRYDSPAMSSANPIRHISDTALWVAVYRAEESERADAVFRDPYARRLLADRVRNPRCCRSSCIETCSSPGAGERLRLYLLRLLLLHSCRKVCYHGYRLADVLRNLVEKDFLSIGADIVEDLRR